MITQVRPEDFKAQRSPTAPGKILHQGELFRGEIVRVYGTGEVLIHSGGKAFHALADQGVREGGVYEFRVKSPAAKDALPVLEVHPSKTFPQAQARSAESMPALLSVLASSAPVKGLGSKTSLLLKNLTRFINSAVYRDQGGDQGVWLSRCLSQGGLFWEGKIARYLMQGIRGNWKSRVGNDLKGILLELQSSLKSERQDREEIVSFSGKVDDALNHIRSVQMENINFLREEGGLCFYIPARPEEGFREAELYVGKPGKEKDVRFSMFLDLSYLGTVGVSATIQNSMISVTFQLPDEKRAELVRTKLPDLESGLRQKGLMPHSLGCVLGGSATSDGDAPFQGAPPADSVRVVI